MIELENFEVVGWEHAIRGMRNPMNSWTKSDSYPGCRLRDSDCVNWNNHQVGEVTLCRDCAWCEPLCWGDIDDDRKEMIIGDNDHDLMMRLAKGGPVHAKYRRMITVYVDITAPLYWWKEFDTYKVGTVANSCSTMHKIHDKEFVLDDFSHEDLICWGDDNDDWYWDKDDGGWPAESILEHTIDALNFYRNKYLEAKVKPMKEEAKRAGLMKKYWKQMIQLLPSSYNQKRTVMLNYEVLANIYRWRKDHKLDEWHTVCDWIEQLPYSEIITGEVREQHA